MRFLKMICCFAVVLCCTDARAENIVMWHAHGSLQLQHLAEQFGKETGHHVEIKVYFHDYLRTELLKKASHQNFPDIILMPADLTGLYNELNLRPLPAEWHLPGVREDIRQSTRVDGEYYGLPWIAGNHLMLYYNKSLVEQVPEDWHALVAWQQQGIETIGWDYSEAYWFMSFWSAFGGEPLRDGKINLDHPSMVEALKFYRLVGQSGVVDTHCHDQCAQQKLTEGKLAFYISGDWAYRHLEASLGDNLGVALLPVIDGRPMRSMSSSYALAFPQRTRNPEAQKVAEAFADFLMSHQVQQSLFSQDRLLPANSLALQQVEAQARDNDLQLIRAFYATDMMPNDTSMSVVWSAFTRGLRRFMEQGFSAERTAKYMQSRADKAMQKR